MNNMQFFPPTPYPIINIHEEILKLKQEIALLKEKINELENKNKHNYLQKDDSLHMMWVWKILFFVSK